MDVEPPPGNAMTLDEAAAFLNVSLGFVLKLLEDGRLPFKTIGEDRHIRAAVLAAYRTQQDTTARKAMVELAEISAELGLYDNPSLPPPKSIIRGGRKGT